VHHVLLQIFGPDRDLLLILLIISQSGLGILNHLLETIILVLLLLLVKDLLDHLLPLQLAERTAGNAR
jgi:hypothetical protein